MSSFEKKLYFAFTTITDTAAVKVHIIISLINIINLKYIIRFENIFSITVSVSLRLRTD